MKRLKRGLQNLGLIAASLVVGLLLCELGARVFLNPADYLSVNLVKDDIMGASALPNAGGFDGWGFRNSEVPRSVDIVAIGDSHTFGNCAKMDESWPHVLGQFTGRGVYNLALGGYGPNQYYHLLKTKALGLKPRLVLCGLYMGDDFDNAVRTTYWLDHWSYLRTSPAEKINGDIWEEPEEEVWNEKLRVWLSRHCMVYKIALHGSPLGRLKGNLQIAHTSTLYDSTTSLIIKDRNISEAFVPKNMVFRIDQELEGVREGMRITFRLLKEMAELCRQNDVQFMVVVIPTKETVFAEFLEHDPKINLRETIVKLVSNERQARAKLVELLGESNIEYIDVLPALQNSVHQELYTRSARDMHPGKNGYRVIAQSVSEALSGKAARK